MAKYYFVHYKCSRNGAAGVDCQKITNTHPLEFQKDCNENFNDGSENYKVISWQSITRVEYQMYKDEI